MLLVLLLCSVGAGCSIPTEVYVLPSNFIGWVDVVVDNPKCGAAERVGKSTIVYVQADGFSCTSTVLGKGVIYREYRRATPDGPRLPTSAHGEGGLIWHETSVSESRRDGTVLLKFVEFFVGPEELSKLPGPHGDPLAQAVKHGILPESAVR